MTNDDTMTGGRDIDSYFALSYSTHLVKERKVLAEAGVLSEVEQMIDEMWRAYAHRGYVQYQATPARQTTLDNCSDEDLAAAGFDRSENDEDDETYYYSKYGDQLDGHAYVYVPTADPLPAASVIVAPRTYLQSMPAEWQHRLVALLERAEDDCEYKVEAVKMEYGEIVPLRFDPVPHYDRGRAYVEPRL